MKIAIGSDHAGWLHKEYIKKNITIYGYTVIDFYSQRAKTIINYPDMVHPIVTVVKEKQVEFGVVLCGSGNGAAITANKYCEIRAAIAWRPDISFYARAHNNANILSIPSRFINEKITLDIVVSFLKTSFEGGRHIMRIQKIVPK